MSPTECFKNHDIPFKGGGETPHRRRVKENTLMWSSPSTSPVTPTSSWPTLEHLGWGPRPPLPLGSPFSMEMKTPWWWATSVCGVGVGVSMAKRLPQLLAPGNGGRASPAPGPWPQSQGREAPSQALGYQSNQVYRV